MFGPCFLSAVSIDLLVLQSSRWENENCLLFFNCLLFAMWKLMFSVFSSRRRLKLIIHVELNKHYACHRYGTSTQHFWTSATAASRAKIWYN